MFGELSNESLAAFRAYYSQLAPDFAYSMLLDSCGWQGKTGGLYVMALGAKRVLQFKQQTLTLDGQEILKNPTPKALRETLNGLFSQNEATQALTANSLLNGWFGALGYELNHTLEPTLSQREASDPMGVMLWFQPQHIVLWCPQENRYETASHQAELPPYSQAKGSETFPTSPKEAVEASLSQPEFESHVETLKQAIQAGQFYQANLSIRFTIRQHYRVQQLLGLYRQLAEKNPSPFSGMLITPEGVIVCNSPERLVKYDAQSNVLETRPIAGTRGRGKTQAESEKIAHTLQTDEKEQAEHKMLVDLERNDLGRVAKAGTVQVAALSELETYSHVTHLISQIEGKKQADKKAWDVLEAVFPGGTITGCPKIRCMKYLQELEPVPRGFYTGGLGYVDAWGNIDFNILIRSAFYRPDGELSFHAGAGIVADSVPANEYRECLRKAQALQGVLTDDPHIALTC